MYTLEDKLIVMGGVAVLIVILLLIAAASFLKLSNKGSGQHT